AGRGVPGLGDLAVGVDDVRAAHAVELAAVGLVRAGGVGGRRVHPHALVREIVGNRAVGRQSVGRVVARRSLRLVGERSDGGRRGRMTRADAEDLAQSLITLGRRQTEDLMADVEQLLGRPRAAAADARRRTDRVLRAAAGLSSTAFPIPDYDELAAAQITS